MTIEVSRPSTSRAQLSSRTVNINQVRNGSGVWTTELMPLQQAGARRTAISEPMDAIERVAVDSLGARVQLRDGRALRLADAASGAPGIVRNPATGVEIGVRTLGSQRSHAVDPGQPADDRSILLTSAEAPGRLAALRARQGFVLRDSAGFVIARRSAGDTLFEMKIDTLLPEPASVRVTVGGAEVMSLEITHRQVLPGVFVRERMVVSRHVKPGLPAWTTTVMLANVQTANR